MKQPAIYQFIGEPSYDFIIYLSSILQNLKKSTLVIDYMNGIQDSIPAPKNQPKPIHYRGVDFICFPIDVMKSNINGEGVIEKGSTVIGYDEKTTNTDNLVLDPLNHIEQYDYIFISINSNKFTNQVENDTIEQDFLNLMYRTSLLKNTSHTYLFSNPIKTHIDRSIQHIQAINNPVTLIIRDIGDGKCNEKYFREYIHENIRECKKNNYIYTNNISNNSSYNSANSGSNVNNDMNTKTFICYYIPFDEVDYEYSIRLSYEPFKEFKNISKEYETILNRIVKEITKIDEIEIYQAYKKARKGVVYESSIL